MHGEFALCFISMHYVDQTFCIESSSWVSKNRHSIPGAESQTPELFDQTLFCIKFTDSQQLWISLMKKILRVAIQSGMGTEQFINLR